MSKKLKETKSDQKDWKEFLNNPKDIFDKDQSEGVFPREGRRFKFDLHGYNIDEANKKVEEIILKCFEEGYKEILIITGKGLHSNKNEDVYSSKEYGKLQTSIPEFIKNNPDLISKIKSIGRADKNLGGEGALIIKLKKIIK